MREVEVLADAKDLLTVVVGSIAGVPTKGEGIPVGPPVRARELQN